MKRDREMYESFLFPNAGYIHGCACHDNKLEEPQCVCRSALRALMRCIEFCNAHPNEAVHGSLTFSELCQTEEDNLDMLLLHPNEHINIVRWWTECTCCSRHRTLSLREQELLKTVIFHPTTGAHMRACACAVCSSTRI